MPIDTELDIILGHAYGQNCTAGGWIRSTRWCLTWLNPSSSSLSPGMSDTWKVVTCVRCVTRACQTARWPRHVSWWQPRAIVIVICQHQSAKQSNCGYILRRFCGIIFAAAVHVLESRNTTWPALHRLVLLRQLILCLTCLAMESPRYKRPRRSMINSQELWRPLHAMSVGSSYMSAIDVEPLQQWTSLLHFMVRVYHCSMGQRRVGERCSTLWVWSCGRGLSFLPKIRTFTLHSALCWNGI